MVHHEYDESIPDMNGSETSSDDLPDSDIYQASSNLESDEDKKIFVALAKEIEIHPTKIRGIGKEEAIDQLLEKAEGNGIEGERVYLLNLSEEKVDLKSALIAKKVKHLSKRAQMLLSTKCIESKAIALSMEDFRPAELLVRLYVVL